MRLAAVVEPAPPEPGVDVGGDRVDAPVDKNPNLPVIIPGWKRPRVNAVPGRVHLRRWTYRILRCAKLQKNGNNYGNQFQTHGKYDDNFVVIK